MSGARLGNFPLQRIGVRGDSMRGSLPPESVDATATTTDSADADLAARVSEGRWILARIWKFGEFSGLDTGTSITDSQGTSESNTDGAVLPPPDLRFPRLERRARNLVGKAIVIQRLGGASGSEPDIVQIKRLIKIARLENGELGFWVEGDNKPASTDSRHWGYLKGSEIRGRVIYSRGLI